jgi:hypothetical protein
MGVDARHQWRFLMALKFAVTLADGLWCSWFIYPVLVLMTSTQELLLWQGPEPIVQ